MKTLALALTILALAQPAAARPVLLELFTSQSCSSCPPAEALLARLQAASPDVAALSFHVDYWDYLSWRDPYSSPAATGRQRHYAAALGTDVYTPQLVVDGRGAAVGSDDAAVRDAIDRAKATQAAGPDVTASAAPGGLAVRVAATAANKAGGGADVLLVGYDPLHETRVAAGENGGAVLRETNVVRSQAVIGRWSGQALTLTVKRPAGLNLAVILQQDDGTILGAAFP